MQKFRKITLAGLIFFFLLYIPVFSQNYSGLSLGLRGGLTTFYGDLANYGNNPIHNFIVPSASEKRMPMGGIFIEWSFNPYIALQARPHYGKVYGKNDDLQQSFEATLWGGNLSVLLRTDRTKTVSFYAIFFGLGLTKWRSARYDIITNDMLGSNGSKEFGATTEGELIAGLGINIQFPKNLYLNIESTIHGINPDKLDSYISGYRTLEGFGYTSIGLGFRFGRGRGRNINCIQWESPAFKRKKTNFPEESVISPGNFD